MARQASLRVFSIQEANRSIAELRKALPALRRILRDIERTESRLGILDLICNRSVASENPDVQEYLSTRVKYHRRITELDGELSRLEEAGFLLRDLDRGVVHFVARRRGKTVLLCWKEGEKRICHWHALGEESTEEDTRRRIDDLDEFSST